MLIGSVRFGIRAQLLISIAALLVLALVPLFFAVASLTRVSMQQQWEQNARSLGRAVAGHVVTHARNITLKLSGDSSITRNIMQIGDRLAELALQPLPT